MALLRIYSKGTNASARSAIWLESDQNGDGTGAVYIQGLLAANSANVGLMANDGLVNSLQLYTPQAVPLQLGTADKARITITGAGNVGIGTNAPTVPLQLFSASTGEIARFQGKNDASNARNYFTLYTTNPGYWWEFSNQDLAGGGNYHGLAFRERSGADPSLARMYLATGGNVGINTTNPQFKLDVNGSFNATALNGAWDQVAHHQDM
jgi:hypothetical protein